MELSDVAGLTAVWSAVALLAIWIVYPTVMAALAALRRRPNFAPAADPGVSVVLATREPIAAIAARVRDLFAADYAADRLEVVVALDGQARADRDAVAAIDPRIVAVDGDEPGGKACALNAGVRAARGDILVFTDTHQRFEPSAIRRLVACLADPAIGAVSGELDLPAGEEGPTLGVYYWRFERWLRRCEARVHSSVGVTGAIYALRRSLWRPLRPGLILDDVYIPMQVALHGHRVGFEQEARAVDVRGTTLEQEYRRKVRTLTGNIQLCAWLPAVLNPFRNPIWLQFLFHKLLRLATPYLLFLFVAALLVLAADRFGPPSPPLLALLALVVLWGVIAPAGPARRLRQLVSWAVALQAATFMATVNGLRGRWDVWRT